MKDIYIYSEIVPSSWAAWGFGVSAEQVIEVLNDAKSDEDVLVHINSPGGFVTESYAIYNALAMHEGKVTTRIEALAASGAGLVSQAGDEIQILENADFMAHEAWGGVTGTAAELHKYGDRLESINGKLVNTYAKRWKVGDEEIREALDNEVWMNADELVESGMADTKIEVKTRDDDEDEDAQAFAIMFPRAWEKAPSRVQDRMRPVGPMPAAAIMNQLRTGRIELPTPKPSKPQRVQGRQDASESTPTISEQDAASLAELRSRAEQGMRSLELTELRESVQ